MTVQLKCFVQSVRFIALYLDEILYINVLVLIILNLSAEHTLVPMSSNKRESTVVLIYCIAGYFRIKIFFAQVSKHQFWQFLFSISK